jgi:hypothetical protein
MNIHNDSGINKMDKCIIYKLAVDRAGVEDGKVSVFNTWSMKVGVGVRASVQSHAIDRVILLATSLNGHTIPDRDVVDILSYFSLFLLITKEELIVPLIGAIIDHPVIARVISIFLNLYTSVDDAKLRGGGNKKHGSFICRAFAIGVNEVDKGWYPCKVDNLVVFEKGTQGFFLTCYIGKSGNGG